MIKQNGVCFMTGKNDVIIFSKDRPWQLEQLIKTTIEFCDFDKIYVMMNMQKDFKKNYEKVIKEYKKEVDFVIEKIFYNTFCDIVNHDRNTISLVVDDVVFFDKFSVKRVAKIMDNSNIFAYHFKLNKNYKFCQPASAPQRIPNSITEFEDYFVWEYGDGDLDWSYPFDLTGSTYLNSSMKWLIKKLREKKIKNPNDLESCGWDYIQNRGIHATGRPMLACPKRRSCVCMALNHSNKQSFTPWNKSKTCSIEYLDKHVFGKYDYDLDFFRNYDQRSVHMTDYRIKEKNSTA